MIQSARLLRCRSCYAGEARQVGIKSQHASQFETRRERLVVQTVRALCCLPGTPTSLRRADYTDWFGPRAGARGEARWSDASWRRHAQVADAVHPLTLY